MNIEIKTKYNIGDNVIYRHFSGTEMKWIETEGYILGVQYATHPFLRGEEGTQIPYVITYGVYAPYKYEDYIDTLIKGEKPYSYAFDAWVQENNILNKIEQ